MRSLRRSISDLTNVVQVLTLAYQQQERELAKAGAGIADGKVVRMPDRLRPR